MSTQATKSPLLSPVITGCIDELQQGILLLHNLSDSDYTYLATPYVDSSIGEHFRHVLDLFHALMLSSHHDLIDYNQRRRGHRVEKNRELAIKELETIIHWLIHLPTSDLAQPVSLITEVCPHKQHDQVMQSSFEREITFASLHASHHYALMKVITKVLNVSTHTSFGFAPTTSSYLRGEA